jgi:hypothetical protein
LSQTVDEAKKDSHLRPYSLLLLSNEKLNNGIHGINALEL